MTDSLDIAQVAKLTGLTSRALRFYEARDLVKPLRTASGRRHYGPAELERLHHILALKRAGLSLAQIQRLVAGRPLDLRGLVSAQIEALDAQASEIKQARTLLTAILSRIDRSEPHRCRDLLLADPTRRHHHVTGEMGRSASPLYDRRTAR